MKLVGTFIKNTDPIVDDILMDKVHFISDSYVIFDGELENDYPYLNSFFILIKSFNHSVYGTEKIVNWLAHSTKSVSKLSEVKKTVAFESLRLVYVKNNQTRQLPKELVNKVADSVGKSDIELRNTHHDRELWLYMAEKTKTAWLGIKLSHHKDYHSPDRKGVLRPQLAYMLNYLSNPKDEETVLDPFAGSGTIMSTREKYFQGKQFISIDTKENRIQEVGSKHRFSHSDFFSANIEPDSIDSIVTDPPWGKFETSQNIPELYTQMFGRFQQILKTKGMLVLITSISNKDLTIEIAKNNFKIKSRYELKVWGQGAIVFVLEKQ